MLDDRIAWTEDEKVMFDMIPADGTAIGNMNLRRVRLTWGDETEGWERYWRVRKLLLDRGVIGVGYGKGGSVYKILPPEEQVSNDNAPEPDVPEEQETIVERNRERTLYEGVRVYVETELLQGFQFTDSFVEIVADRGVRRRGRWTRPDILAGGCRIFKYLPGKEVDIISIEVKPSMETALDGVFETLAHTAGTTYSYLAVNCPNAEDHPHFKRVQAECARLGLGFFSFAVSDDNDTYEWHLDARRTTTDNKDIDAFLKDSGLTPATLTRLSNWTH